MSAADEEIVAAAKGLLHELVQQARDEADAVLSRAADEAGQLIREVKDRTGVEIYPPLPPPAKPPTVMDVSLGDLAGMAEQCQYLLAAVKVLQPHVRFGETRTVGAVVKARVDLATGVIALDFLRRSRFFPGEGV